MPVLLPPALCLPLPSRAPRCVLRVVPSGRPFPLPAGTPIHAVCAFRGFSPVALWDCAGCGLCVSALIHPRCTRLTPSGRCGAHTARGTCAGRRWTRSTQFVPLHVSCPGLVLRLFSTGGGGGPDPSPPCRALGLVSPPGRACVPGAVWCPGWRGGGRGGPLGRDAACVLPPLGCAGAEFSRGGFGGGGLVAARPSLCLPCTGTTAGFFCVA